MLQYFIKMLTGRFEGLNTEGVANVFGEMLGQPAEMVIFMIIVVIVCFAICGLGLQKGVEKITKVMMILRPCPACWALTYGADLRPSVPVPIY